MGWKDILKATIKESKEEIMRLAQEEANRKNVPIVVWQDYSDHLGTRWFSDERKNKPSPPHYWVVNPMRTMGSGTTVPLSHVSHTMTTVPDFNEKNAKERYMAELDEE